MGEVGEEIPHLEEDRELLDPDTSHLSMGEVGEEQYRKREEAAPPDTSHISLDDES